jgi:hypothetical protein
LALALALAPSAAGAADAPAAGAPPTAAPAARVEARSADLFVVGVVEGAHMAIHVSRIADNAPVRDAAVTVVLRGTPHPAVADADGGYSIDTPDLALPGTAAVQFQVTLGATHQELAGTLAAAPRAGSQSDDKGGSRQLGWWVLNFGVCIAFLMLWTRRKKRAEEEDEKSAP